MKKIQDRLKIKLSANQKCLFIEMLKHFDRANKEEMNLIFDIIFRNHKSLHTILDGSIEIAGVSECLALRYFMGKIENPIFLGLIRGMNAIIDPFIHSRELNACRFIAEINNNLMLNK